MFQSVRSEGRRWAQREEAGCRPKVLRRGLSWARTRSFGEAGRLGWARKAVSTREEAQFLGSMKEEEHVWRWQWTNKPQRYESFAELFSIST